MNNTNTTGLFVDCGYAKLGYCIGDITNLNLIDYGCLITKDNISLEIRIYRLYEKLVELHNLYNYKLIILEEPCFNGKKGAYLNRVLGMLYILVGSFDTKYLTYNPSSLKKKLTGIGTASKKDILFNVSKYFSINLSKEEDDTIDAIGLYLCYLLDNGIIIKKK